MRRELYLKDILGKEKYAELYRIYRKCREKMEKSSLSVGNSTDARKIYDEKLHPQIKNALSNTNITSDDLIKSFRDKYRYHNRKSGFNGSKELSDLSLYSESEISVSPSEIENGFETSNTSYDTEQDSLHSSKRRGIDYLVPYVKSGYAVNLWFDNDPKNLSGHIPRLPNDELGWSDELAPFRQQNNWQAKVEKEESHIVKRSSRGI